MVNRHAVYGYALMRSVGDIDTLSKMSCIGNIPVAAKSTRWALIVLGLSAWLAACGSVEHTGIVTPQVTADLVRIGQTVAADAGYSNDVVELTGNRVQLQPTVNDPKLANVDENHSKRWYLRFAPSFEQSLASKS